MKNQNSQQHIPVVRSIASLDQILTGVPMQRRTFVPVQFKQMDEMTSVAIHMARPQCFDQTSGFVS